MMASQRRPNRLTGADPPWIIYREYCRQKITCGYGNAKRDVCFNITCNFDATMNEHQGGSDGGGR
jgi:hypothetical protein